MELCKFLTAEGVLPFRANALQGRYGLIVQYPTLRTCIHYTMHCSYASWQSSGRFLYDLHRGDVFVNRRRPSSKLHTLAEALAASVFPLRVQTDHTHKLINVIHDSTRQHRLANTIRDMGLSFPHLHERNFIDVVKHHVESPATMLRALQQNLFCQLFFFPLFGKYSNEHTTGGTLVYPFSKRCETINTTITLPQTYTDDRIDIGITGTTAAPDQPITFAARYRLFAANLGIASIVGKFTRPANAILPELTFEIYHLDPELHAGTHAEDDLSSVAPAQRKNKFLLGWTNKFE